MQVDSLDSLGDEKKPSEYLIWDAPPEELEKFLNRTVKQGKEMKATFQINEGDIE